MNFDPRVTPARPDLAARFLEGKVQAARFVDGELREVVEAQAPVRREPRPDASLDTEALKGERVMVYETIEEGWAWVQLQNDRYVGWMPASALAVPGPEPTHRVATLRAPVLMGASIKMPTLEVLPFGATLAILREEGRFGITSHGCYVPLVHVARLNEFERDFVAVAERFVGVPYVWGGKTSLGLDCSALVQVSLTACGIACPRDSDMQEAVVGRPVAVGDDLSGVARGDLVFWKGHVAIVRDEKHFLHANGFHMAVAIEPIRETLTRFAAEGSSVTGIRRL
ncbi:MAG TPA: NlpC/P60 family protein [Xanthobacteraceae bacterium]|nr:NlpC/P60 family protein [Xanthobacteraceae bacterium]